MRLAARGALAGLPVLRDAGRRRAGSTGCDADAAGRRATAPRRRRRRRGEPLDSAPHGRRDHTRARQAGRRPPRALPARSSPGSSGAATSCAAPGCSGSRGRSRSSTTPSTRASRSSATSSTFITSGPVLALAVRGEDAIAGVRTMMGATNPRDAAPGTIRGDFALELSGEHRARLGLEGEREARARAVLPRRPGLTPSAGIGSRPAEPGSADTSRR